MKIYTIIYKEDFDSNSKIGGGGGFDIILDDIYCKNFSTLDFAKDRLKKLFAIAKNQPVFKDFNFSNIELEMEEENTVYYTDDEGFE